MTLDINYDYVDYWDLRNVAETYNAGTADLDEARKALFDKDCDTLTLIKKLLIKTWILDK